MDELLNQKDKINLSKDILKQFFRYGFIAKMQKLKNSCAY